MSTATANRLRVVSPEGVFLPLDPVAATEGLDDLRGKQIGFLSNTKANIDLLFQSYAGILQDRYGTSAMHDRKPSAAVGAGPLIGELSARAHGIITGMGD